MANYLLLTNYCCFLQILVSSERFEVVSTKPTAAARIVEAKFIIIIIYCCLPSYLSINPLDKAAAFKKNQVPAREQLIINNEGD